MRTPGVSPDLSACIDLLVAAGGTTRYGVPVVFDLLRGRLDLVAAHLDASPALVAAQFPELDFGTTGGRMLTLSGATLLHVAAEYCNAEAVSLLLERGAAVNAPASISDSGLGGQTAVFHAATQFGGLGLPVLRTLIERGADLSVRARLPGHYERPGEVVEGTALAYVLHVEHEVTPGDKSATVALLRAHGALE